MNKITVRDVVNENGVETIKFEGITVNLVKYWESVYLNIDVIHHLTLSMPCWLDSNRSIINKNYKRFIVKWLSTRQDWYDQFNRR